jgi:hypothetical protein
MHLDSRAFKGRQTIRRLRRRGERTEVKDDAFTGSAWDTVGTEAGLSNGGAYSLALAISNLGVPYVAFLDDANGEKATVVKTSFDP